MRELLCLFVMIAALCGVTPSGMAQDIPAAEDRRPPTSGDIPMQDTSPAKRDPRSAGLSDVGVWARSLAQAASQGSGSIAPLKTEGVDYLAALYLFCAQKFGACPFILESIFEADLLSAHQAGLGQCAIMSNFWKRWIDIDGDKRLQFSVSVGRAGYLGQFNASSRQRFIKCKETVSAELSGKEPFSSRYGSGTLAAKSTATLLALIEEVEQKQVDVFAAAGL